MDSFQFSPTDFSSGDSDSMSSAWVQYPPVPLGLVYNRNHRYPFAQDQLQLAPGPPTPKTWSLRTLSVSQMTHSKRITIPPSRRVLAVPKSVGSTETHWTDLPANFFHPHKTVPADTSTLPSFMFGVYNSGDKTISPTTISPTTCPPGEEEEAYRAAQEKLVRDAVELLFSAEGSSSSFSIDQKLSCYVDRAELLQASCTWGPNEKDQHRPITPPVRWTGKSACCESLKLSRAFFDACNSLRTGAKKVVILTLKCNLCNFDSQWRQ